LAKQAKQPKGDGEEAPKSPLTFMLGSGGSPDYLVFARSGDLALGIKPYGFADGKHKGVPGTTYFVARLRSAPAGDLFKDVDAAAKVVAFKKPNGDTWSAWPKVDWINKGKDRSSTNISAFIRGSLKGDVASQQLLIDNAATVAKKMADYLVTLAGAENLVITPRKMASWIDSIFAPGLEVAQNNIASSKAVVEALAETMIDAFGMESAILAKVYESLPKNKKGQEAEDIEEDQSSLVSDDEDTDAED
jgi:hypothetical protein